MQFRLYPLRFSYVAHEIVRFPAESGNTFRGAFGAALRKIASMADYVRLFEPAGSDDKPSGLRNPPRPFVFRTSHLDGCTVEPGAEFHVDFHSFDLRNPQFALLEEAFRHLRLPGRAELVHRTGTDAPLVLSLDPAPRPVNEIRVRFVTPTELKVDGGLAQRPEFGVLAARIRDRISALSEYYGSGPLTIDFQAFGERAAHIQMTRCEIRMVEAARRSRRTGQVHSLGGFVGEAEYQGDLTEFLPYLNAAKWTGVGRQTVWGKGVVVTETLS